MKCVSCGSEIEYGINSYMWKRNKELCVFCDGGWPKYPTPTMKVNSCTSWDELDAMENRCLNDWSD